MASTRMLLAAAPLFFAGAFLTAVLGGDLSRRPRPAEFDTAAPPASPPPKAPQKARDAAYEPWELVSV